MGEDKKEKKVVEKVRTVSITDYYSRALGPDGKQLQGIEKRKAALILLYSENKVIDKVESKGESIFIVEK